MQGSPPVMTICLALNFLAKKFSISDSLACPQELRVEFSFTNSLKGIRFSSFTNHECFVSHQLHPTGQPCSLIKIEGLPVKCPSPWIVSKISLSFGLRNAYINYQILVRQQILGG